MELNKLNKEQLVAKCEELIAENETLTAKCDELTSANETLSAAPKGNAGEIQAKLDAALQENNDLKGVVTSLNDQLRLQASTRGTNKPLATIDVEGQKVNVLVIHALRKNQKNHSPQEIASDLEWVKELYINKSTAIQVVA